MGASGAVTLLESHKDSSNMLKTGVVETLIQESPILEMLPMTSFVGAAYETNLEFDLPDPEFRQVNATYNRSHGTDRKVFWGVAILGGEVFINNFIVRTWQRRRYEGEAVPQVRQGGGSYLRQVLLQRYRHRQRLQGHQPDRRRLQPGVRCGQRRRGGALARPRRGLRPHPVAVLAGRHPGEPYPASQIPSLLVTRALACR